MARKDVVDVIGASIAPVERETLNDRVYREIKNSIMAGAFKPGSELTLRAVADALGTSMMPVRDAMRRLVAEHALEVRPSRKLAIPVLSAEEFLELRRIRILLEGEAAALAAERMSRRQLTQLRSIARKLRALDQDDRRNQSWSLNKQFHFTIYAAANSPLLLSIVESLWLQIGPLLTRVPVSRAVKGSSDPHELVLQALEDRDAEAARAALEADLVEASSQVLKELAAQDALRG